MHRAKARAVLLDMSPSNSSPQAVRSEPGLHLPSNMDGTASMKIHALAGIHPSQNPYAKPAVTNFHSNAEEQGRLLISHFEESEPPLKRMRISDGLTEAPLSIPSEEEKHPVTPDDAQTTLIGNGIHTLNGPLGQSLIDGYHKHPISSTTTTSLKSLKLSKSTTPPTTPSQILSTPPVSAGVSILDSTKVDLSKCRPRSSIPAKLAPAIYAQQCVAAAYGSRLDPYALHEKEQAVLQDRLCHMHVTVYLNIRNGILRLWTRNPMVSVTREEALGCAKDYRWMNLAAFAYDWLARHGYINFGCVEIPIPPVPPRRGRRKDGPIIIVVGGGVGGLGCARQLEGLFRHYRDADTAPRVIVLEGRRRIGGRVYSHPLRSLQSNMLPPGLVPKAEMGAQIIVGFEHGNPLDQIVRGQLALRYHLLRDISTIYDIDGSPVDEVRDSVDEKLYNDVLDRTGFYRHNAMVKPTAEGDRNLIDSGRETTTDDGLTVRQYEDARAAGTIDLLVPTKRVRRRRGVGHKTAEIEPNDVAADLVGPSEDHPAALACQATGWKLNPGYSATDTLELDYIVSQSRTQTLGAVMDEGVKQYQRMLPLTPKDMRLLNWHFANLEYANATNINKLSLSGWDQDIGNEFEGEHSTVIGGYQQLPYGLYSLPTKLDVRTNKIVTNISYDAKGSGKHKAAVQCEDGEKFMADHIVYTGSLGTLKHRTINFDPPLPEWKLGAIDRLGFGVMNKVVLVFDQPFWDVQRDMFGLLREPTTPNSMAQEDYATNRGRFYLFWNCLKTTGLPVLIALMAGDAAHQAENTPDDEIIAEVTAQLRNVFKDAVVPDPLETIITRWASDRFTRGSYSYVAAEALPDDYNLMAQNVGNLHFAGEATCGTHPATVHGAYLSGLRAASEVIETIVGPIEIPEPLVPEKPIVSAAQTPTGTTTTAQNAIDPLSTTAISTNITTPARNPHSTDKHRKDTYDQAMWTVIYAEIGSAPLRPQKAGLNPFLLYQKDYWAKCRDQCDEARRASSKNPNAKAARDEIRAALGQMWRKAEPAEKQPYIDQVDTNRRTNEEQWEQYKVVYTEWERRSYEIKDQWCAQNPYEQWEAPQSGLD